MFEVIDFQINESQRDLLLYQNSGIDIEKIKHQYLRSLVLLIVSEYENIIEKIFNLRASLCNDLHVTNYVRFQIDKKFRSPDLSKINQTLGYFDDCLKKTFIDNVSNTKVHAAWDNLMKARHYIVHKQGTLNITYDELLTTYPETKKVIFEIVKLLGVDQSQL